MLNERALAKAGIMVHMNTDHRDVISRYLEHYCKVSSFTARKARLAYIALAFVRIDAGGTMFTILLEPPLQSWSEAHDRLLLMDQVALEGLGRSQITIKHYIPPQGVQAVVFVVCAITYVFASQRISVQPGSFLYDHALGYFPAGASFVARVQPFVLAPMVAIHVVEAAMMARKLQKHNVAFPSGLWWLWVVSCFIEGFGALKRFEALVEQGRRQIDKQTHLCNYKQRRVTR